MRRRYTFQQLLICAQQHIQQRWLSGQSVRPVSEMWWVLSSTASYQRRYKMALDASMLSAQHIRICLVSRSSQTSLANEMASIRSKRSKVINISRNNLFKLLVRVISTRSSILIVVSFQIKKMTKEVNMLWHETTCANNVTISI